MIMGLIKTISYLGATRHVHETNRVAREFSRQGPQGQMEYDSKKKEKKKKNTP